MRKKARLLQLSSSHHGSIMQSQSFPSMVPPSTPFLVKRMKVSYGMNDRFQREPEYLTAGSCTCPPLSFCEWIVVVFLVGNTHEHPNEEPSGMNHSVSIFRLGNCEWDMALVHSFGADFVEGQGSTVCVLNGDQSRLSRRTVTRPHQVIFARFSGSTKCLVYMRNPWKFANDRSL
jgi:hypothetical protein